MLTYGQCVFVRVHNVIAALDTDGRLIEVALHVRTDGCHHPVLATGTEALEHSRKVIQGKVATKRRRRMKSKKLRPLSGPRTLPPRLVEGVR